MSNFTIETRYESKRGCGFRQPGGFYLVSDGPAIECCKLPIDLAACPTCGQGIKPSRGWTCINPRELFKINTLNCSRDRTLNFYGYPLSLSACPLPTIDKEAGLLWVGSMFYRSPSEFLAEAKSLGISRRISQIPRKLVIGSTWVFLAHREIPFAAETKSGVFAFFRPERIEYVVAETDTPEKLEKLAAKGITLVKVEPKQTSLDLSSGCSHPGANGPCMPRLSDNKCIWCETDMTGVSYNPLIPDTDINRSATECAAYPCNTCDHKHTCNLSELRS